MSSTTGGSTSLYTASTPPVSQTRPPGITFLRRDVNPPSEVYVTVDDVLLVNVWNSLSGLQLRVAWRLLLANGTIVRETQVCTPNTSRTEQQFYWPLTEGFLLSVHIEPIGAAPRRGQCWAELNIARLESGAPTEYQPLAADYVCFNSHPGFPGSPINDSVDGSGYLSTYTAFAEVILGQYAITVPTNARWLLHSGYFSLTTAAGGSNRQAGLAFEDAAGNYVIESMANISQAPSTSIIYGAGDLSGIVSVAGAYSQISWPQNLQLSAGARLFFGWLNPGSGDVLSVSNALVEEWLEPTS